MAHNIRDMDLIFEMLGDKIQGCVLYFNNRSLILHFQ